MTAAVNSTAISSSGYSPVQNGIINQGQLVHAFQAWTLDKAKSLADHLEARGDLTAPSGRSWRLWLRFTWKRTAATWRQSLAAVSAGKSIREGLENLGDPELGATLGRASGHGSTDDGDVDRTASYAVGAATSEGQRFRVLRPHARGGLGADFVAPDGELHREVALKQIPDRHADDATSRQRFLIEAEITGALEHPGIVPVYGLGTYTDGRPFYAMRFIRGDSLREAIEHFHGEPGRVSAASRSKRSRSKRSRSKRESFEEESFDEDSGRSRVPARLAEAATVVHRRLLRHRICAFTGRVAPRYQAGRPVRPRRLRLSALVRRPADQATRNALVPLHYSLHPQGHNLRQLTPQLRTIGTNVTFDRVGNLRRITITQIPSAGGGGADSARGRGHPPGSPACSRPVRRCDAGPFSAS